MGAAILAVVLTLACGVAVAAAATQPLLVGAVQNPSGGPFAGSLSAPFSVAAEHTSQGWFAYAPAYYNNDLTAINMSNPISPVITNAVQPSGNELYGSDTVNIFGGLAYVVSKNQNPACPTLPVTSRLQQRQWQRQCVERVQRFGGPDHAAVPRFDLGCGHPPQQPVRRLRGHGHDDQWLELCAGRGAGMPEFAAVPARGRWATTSR